MSSLGVLLGLCSTLGLGTAQDAPAIDIPLEVVGQEAGPLRVGDLTISDFARLPVGKPFEYGQIMIYNVSSREVRIDTVRPYRLSPALQLLALQAWLIPRNAHLSLPGASREWPLKDPRARSAVPARAFSIPGHRIVQIIFGLRARRAGVHRLEGAHVTFTDKSRRYDWTFRDVLIARAISPKP